MIHYVLGSTQGNSILDYAILRHIQISCIGRFQGPARVLQQGHDLNVHVLLSSPLEKNKAF